MVRLVPLFMPFALAPPSSSISQPLSEKSSPAGGSSPGSPGRPSPPSPPRTPSTLWTRPSPAGRSPGFRAAASAGTAPSSGAAPPSGAAPSAGAVPFAGAAPSPGAPPPSAGCLPPAPTGRPAPPSGRSIPPAPGRSPPVSSVWTASGLPPAVTMVKSPPEISRSVSAWIPSPWASMVNVPPETDTTPKPSPVVSSDLMPSPPAVMAKVPPVMVTESFPFMPLLTAVTSTVPLSMSRSLEV